MTPEESILKRLAKIELELSHAEDERKVLQRMLTEIQAERTRHENRSIEEIRQSVERKYKGKGKDK